MRVFLLFAAVGCGGGQTPVQVVTVSALRTPCQSFFSELCLTMTPDFETSELLFFGIEGYTHRWGIESELRVHREPVNPPIPDGPSELIILDETLIEREPIVAPFDLDFPFNGNRWFSGSAPQLDLLGTGVQCEATLCADIISADVNGFSFRVTMELTENDQVLSALSIQ